MTGLRYAGKQTMANLEFKDLKLGEKYQVKSPWKDEWLTMTLSELKRWSGPEGRLFSSCLFTQSAAASLVLFEDELSTRLRPIPKVQSVEEKLQDALAKLAHAERERDIYKETASNLKDRVSTMERMIAAAKAALRV